MSDLVCRCGHPQFAHAAVNGFGMCTARETVIVAADPCLCPAFRPMPVDESHPDFCAFHGEVEEPSVSDYHGCGECGHVWRSEGDFRRDMVKLFESLMSLAVPKPQDVRSCPLCAHDF